MPARRRVVAAELHGHGDAVLELADGRQEARVAEVRELELRVRARGRRGAVERELRLHGENPSGLTRGPRRFERLELRGRLREPHGEGRHHFARGALLDPRGEAPRNGLVRAGLQ
mmetsp:Transcript_23830/g.77005  ORF Transcript_23830/g.77005 Transcript_23830/m.77005 type:complete len:115 (-) Transcript_23830:340-684(-)